MSSGKPSIGPWPIVILLAVLIAAQAVMLSNREPAPQQSYEDAVIVPIRPPLTRPDPREALVMAPDRDEPATGDDEAAAAGMKVDELRYALTEDAFAMAQVLTMPQMMHMFGHRDELASQHYEGKLYRDLEAMLEKIVGESVEASE